MKIAEETAPAGIVNFALLLSANAILASALPMLIVLGGLAGLMLAPTPGLATLPLSISTLAGLIAAAPFSLFMGRFGRQAGFLLGAACAAAGGAAGLFGMMESSFLLLLAGHFLLGAALTCFQFFRFAAAEVVPDQWRSVAISLMLTSGLVAALLGPEIFARTTGLLAPFPFAGAYGAIIGLAVIGALPLLLVRGMPRPVTSGGPAQARIDVLAILRRPTVAAAVFAAAISQGVMALLMVPTPIVMVGCGFDAATAGSVVGWHVVAMFAPSFVTGFLIKRFGASLIVLTGLALLAISALIAATGLSLAHFYVSLIVLGVGWNFGFIGATSLLADALAPEERASIQGINDTAIALASTIAAFSSGALVAGFGWTLLVLGALPVVAVTAFVLRWTWRRSGPAA
ncbi:MFS transporter [Jannaschia aquimarina]|uniref:Major Facilitator Superfamily protein n=1 Tax=Jannaschia aquimarina TaxID=935700 RepID=A0A0D1D250_9RHOB|nr:MFS transporter [Jannaschia aquimarina]KIT14208.1 Major Facilitator Superfamily protein [Jannaschia aquimarina]SNS48184.1 Predicted arabinose efflux permease, MFS family [Jannaschia aquimarina]